MIGRAVAARLAAAGAAQRLHRRSELDFDRAEQYACDALVRGCDAIVHCAALVHHPSAAPDLFDRLNVRPTRMLADAAARLGARTFVFLSTVGVYGPGPFEFVREDAELKPATPYALSKVRCEEILAAASAIPHRVVLRPALVFGEGDRGNLLALIRLIDKGLYCHIAGNRASKSLICASDLAAIVERCLSSLPPGCHVFNAANTRPVQVTELANLIASCLGRTRPRSLPGLVVQAGAALLGKRDAVRTLSTTTTCSIERLASAIGSLSITSIGEALATEIRWARSAALLSPGVEAAAGSR